MTSLPPIQRTPFRASTPTTSAIFSDPFNECHLRSFLFSPIPKDISARVAFWGFVDTSWHDGAIRRFLAGSPGFPGTLAGAALSSALSGADLVRHPLQPHSLRVGEISDKRSGRGRSQGDFVIVDRLGRAASDCLLG